MAKLNKMQPGVTSVGGENEIVKWFNVSSRNPSSFSGFVIENTTAAGVTTSVYFWCDTSAKLRYGTTVPTFATQDSAGTAIGS